MAKTDPDAGAKGISCLLLEKGTPGYEVSLIEDKIGNKGSPTNQIFIEDCRIPRANLVGNEGQGMRRLVRESCDVLIRLPMRGKIESLNAAVAGSVVLYLTLGARGK